MTKNWRELIKPRGLQVDQDTLTDTYGKFVAEPLERGFGITIGNVLRRVLLSSLQGAAITSMRIEGVEHEFTTISNVAEDVTDIILNLKEVLLRMHTQEEKSIRIEVEGPKEVKAGDIIVDHDVEVLNPGHHLFTLSEGGGVRMSFIALLKTASSGMAKASRKYQVMKRPTSSLMLARIATISMRTSP